MKTLPVPAAPPRGATLLVDASAYFFRAWFGVPDVFHDRRGRSLNGVVGFARTLAQLLVTARPAAVAVAFDEALFSGFRHRLDPGYKANRVLPDTALAFQLATARRLVEDLGLVALASREYEADDLLATLARRASGGGHAVVVAGEDKDLAQLLALPGVSLWQASRGRLLDAAAACAHWGVAPGRMAEWQALVGDAADNIPGVPGIGATTAAALLAHCEDLARLLRDPAAAASVPVRGARRLPGLLAGHAPRVRLNLRLTRLADGVTGLPRLPALRLRLPDEECLQQALRRAGLPAGSARPWRPLLEDAC